MNLIAHRGLRVLLIVTLAAASLASTAAADRGRGRDYGRGGPPSYGHGHGHRIVRGYGGGLRPIIVERHSSAGPAIVGFLGGLVLGSVLSDAYHAASSQPAYVYYDPYCRERFVSFEAYENHLQYQDHPPVLDVLDSRDGRCVDSYVWQDGHWTDQPYQDRGGVGWDRGSDSDRDEGGR
ncbi:MAG TPA: hypothetical protein VMS88_03110 [Terriglobales bacterium]|nr:hypothetical protein [Terriglobales bacterium]